MDEVVNEPIAAQSTLHNLFPIPVGQYSIDYRPTKKETRFILDQPQRNNMGNSTSQDNKILNSKELATLRKLLEQKINLYFDTVYNPKHAVKLRITQSWCNYTQTGQFHHKHSHPNSFISGVFYLETTSTDRIHFFTGAQPGIKLPPKNWNIWNSESWWFEATKHSLFLFPSSLTHMVETVTAQQTRISLSFNTFLVGTVGEASELTLLELD